MSSQRAFLFGRLQQGKKHIGLLAAIAGGGLLGGVAVAYAASGGGDPGVIHGCVDHHGGLRIIDMGSETCRSNEDPISWNRQGPAGPAGTVGAQGPAGSQGEQGEQGEPGRDGRDGQQGPAGAPGPAGAQGPAGPPGADGQGGGVVEAAPQPTCGGGLGFSKGDDRAKNMFLKVDGIKGESVFDGHQGEITVDAFSWGGVSLPTAADGSPAGTARVCSMSLTVELDQAYPALLQAASAGTHLPRATLSVLKGGEDPFTFLNIDFHDVVVRATGQVIVFTATSVTVTYTRQDNRGGASGSTSFSFHEAPET